MKRFKRAAAFAAAIAMTAAATCPQIGSVATRNAATAKAAGGYNYAEALQKSMFFYEVQQAGVLPEWNNVPWRADSMVDESGKETDQVPGGWFDAGDHFKFTLTNAYSASIIAWGYIQYKDAIDKAGMGELYRNNIQWGLDYVKNCDLGGGKMIGTIGDFTGGSTDHNIWCSAEVYLRKHHLNNNDWERPYDVIENSCVAALSAAALAQGYIIFKDTDPKLAEEYLTHAKDLFDGANAIADYKDIGAMAGMYSTTSWTDDAMYAANWLYMATGDQSYLDKCKTDYIPTFPTESQSTDKKYTWGLCWDDTSQAAAFLYAMNTGDKEWIDHVSHHLDYWIDGYGGKKVDYTPDGMAWLFNWGSARHATTTAWLAKLASDTLFKDDATLSKKYDDWAKSQMDYVFGDNALGMSYVLGMGDLQPSAFHHRTASGIHDDHWNDLGQEPDPSAPEAWQTEYAHTLYGALVGGPNKDGKYVNSVAQYEYSEVAIDYNAGYTAALCAMVDDFGGDIDESFPPVEEPKWAEWEVAAVLNGSGDSYTELKAWSMNHTAWPARVAENICYRYYFDISEALDMGLSVSDIKVEAKSQQYSEGEQGFATVEGPFQYDGNIYYAEIRFADGRAMQPTGQSEHRDEVQFRVSVPDAIAGQSTKGAWDPTNDWSYEPIPTAGDSLKSAQSLNDHITMYVNDVLVWGIEPDGTKPEPGTPDIPDAPIATPTETKPSNTEATKPVETDVIYGDADVSGEVNVADAIKVGKAVMGADALEPQGKINADVNLDKAVTSDDMTFIVKSLAQICTLPVV